MNPKTAKALIYSIITAFLAYPADAPATVSSHSIDISIDLDKRTVEGQDLIKLKDATKVLRLLIRKGSEVTHVEEDGEAIEYSVRDYKGGAATEILIDIKKRDAVERAIKIGFKGTFPGIERARESIKRGLAFVEDGVIGREGVFLPSGSLWFPQEEEGPYRAEITITLPEGYSSIAPGGFLGSTLSEGRVKDRWRTTTPVDGVDLVAGRYVVEKEDYKGIGVYTFFFQKDDKLSRTYIDKTKKYLDLYGNRFGAYPFEKFAVVENFLPTGYGMPSFTLLGSSVIRLPFIPDTSLGHEIAHSWWGNSVYADYAKGNWVEALTTYTADYLYERNRGEDAAREFRITKLRGYKSYAGAGIALKDFVEAEDPAERAVGYNKGVMVFNMLERLIGNDAFEKGLRLFYERYAFRKASWEDIRASFEAASGKDLKRFFDEWVDRPGGPELRIEGAALKESRGAYSVSFRILQTAPTYRLSLPVLFKTAGGDVWKEVEADGKATDAEVELSSRPLSFEIDPGYENFRVLSDDEIPPLISGCLGDKAAVIIKPSMKEALDKYSGPAEALSKDFGGTVVLDTDEGVESYLKEKTVFIFGGPGENKAFPLALGSLKGVADIGKDSFNVGGYAYDMNDAVLVISAKNRVNQGKTLCIFTGGDRNKVTEAGSRMKYFSQQSWLVFGAGRQPVKGTFEGKKTLRHEF